MGLGKRREIHLQELWIAADQSAPTLQQVYDEKAQPAAGQSELRRLGRVVVPTTLRGRRPTFDSARGLLPDVAGRLLRGHRLAVGNRLAVRRLSVAQSRH